MPSDLERRRQQPRLKSMLGPFIWVIVLLALFVLLSVARAEQWQNYDFGGTRYYRNDYGWHGQSYHLGGTTYSDFYGPRGETRHCSSYELSGNIYTNCH